MKIILPRIIFPRPKVPFTKILQGGFLLIYILGCALIVIPQIDYKTWYPSSIGIHDYKLGLEFTQHKKLTVERTEEELQSNEMNILVAAIYQRAKHSKLKDLYIERTDTTLSIHVPNEYSDRYLASLISPGKIEFKKLKPPKDPEAEIDALHMLDPANYEDTGIKPGEIQSAKITNSDDTYTYIELKTNADQIRRLTKIANDPDNSTLATMIDGELNLTWILPPDNVNTVNPTIVIMKNHQETEVLISQILNDPVPIPPLPYEITAAKPLLSNIVLYWTIGALLGVFALGLSYKIFIQKESLKIVSTRALLIIGLLTVLKLTSISFSFPAILTVIISIGALTVIQYVHYPTVLGILAISSIILHQSVSSDQGGSTSALLVISIYSIIFYLFSYFSGLHEEK